MRTFKTSPRALAATAAMLLALAGCGDDATSGGEQTSNQSENENTTPEKDFNDADVSFAQGMIPHHEQAITMSELAPEPAGDDAVRELAEQIMQAQDPEIQIMSGWLEDWNESAEPSEHEGHDMAGMMSPEQLSQL